MGTLYLGPFNEDSGVMERDIAVFDAENGADSVVCILILSKFRLRNGRRVVEFRVISPKGRFIFAQIKGQRWQLRKVSYTVHYGKVVMNFEGGWMPLSIKTMY
jgi:hypothetical protein